MLRFSCNTTFLDKREGEGKKVKLTPPNGVYAQWSEKGSYR